MPCEQVVHESTDDRMRLAAELRDDTTDQETRRSMPLQIDRSVRTLGAVNFGPSVGSTNTFVFGCDEPEIDQFSVAHDSVSERSCTGSRNVDESLHRLIRRYGLGVF